MMRPVYLVALCAAVLAGCQQKPTITAATATAAPVATTAAASPAEPVAAPVAPALSAEEQKFFREFDLSPLLAKDPDNSEVMNGFYGPDHYRIEFALLEVRRDPADPTHYFVKGKNRFKKSVTPFSGDLLFRQIGGQALLKKAPEGYPAQQAREYLASVNETTAYSALGTFTLREDTGYKGAGVFQGEVVVDFAVDEQGGLTPYTRNNKQNARGGGALFEGSWTSAETRQPKPVLWVQNIFYFQQDIFRDFIIGERDMDFNPKYAKLGWDSYWENEEWWAEPSQVTAKETETASEEDTATVISTSL
jgi:hypothetical protein